MPVPVDVGERAPRVHVLVEVGLGCGQQTVADREVAGAVIQQDPWRHLVGAVDVPDVQVGRAVTVDIGRRGGVREVVDLREVGRRVNQLPARRRQDQRVLIARKRGVIPTVIGDEHVGTMVAVEVRDHDLARDLGARNIALEDRTRAIREVALPIAQQDRDRNRVLSVEGTAREQDVLVPVPVEVRHRDRAVPPGNKPYLHRRTPPRYDVGGQRPTRHQHRDQPGQTQQNRTKANKNTA